MCLCYLYFLFVSNSFLLLLVRPGAPSSFFLLVVMPLLLVASNIGNDVNKNEHLLGLA